MKKTLKIIMIIIIVISLFCLIYISLFNVRTVYKVNWNIDGMPNSKKLSVIINHVGAGDILAFDIRYYSEKNLKKLIELDFFKKVDSEFEVKIREPLAKFTHYLQEEEINKFNKYFNIDYLNNSDNYYVLLEEISESKGYTFEILIVDTKDRKLYSIFSNYG